MHWNRIVHFGEQVILTSGTHQFFPLFAVYHFCLFGAVKNLSVNYIDNWHKKNKDLILD
jgi:hypothetical protein